MTRHRFAKKPLFDALLGLAVVVAALTAARAERRGGPEKMMLMRQGGPMAEADANGDGSIDAGEWNALFAKIDADGNGKLEEAEMVRHHHEAMPPEAFALMIAHHADTDRNGQVSAAEWKAHVAEIDTNDDGNLSADELQFRHRMRAGESAETATASLPPFAAQWDTNDDGTLEASELDALFAKADEDGDGVLTFPHMRQERHGFRHH